MVKQFIITRIRQCSNDSYRQKCVITKALPKLINLVAYSFAVQVCDARMLPYVLLRGHKIIAKEQEMYLLHLPQGLLQTVFLCLLN